MAENIMIEVDPFAPKMSEAEFAEAITAMNGTTVHDGEGFDRLACIANDPDRARQAFVAAMTEKLGEAPGTQLIWRWPPQVGERRSGATIQHVASARYLIMRLE